MNHPQSPTHNLIAQLAKIGCHVCEADLDRCLERAELRLVERDTFERWSWGDSPERMGK